MIRRSLAGMRRHAAARRRGSLAALAAAMAMSGCASTVGSLAKDSPAALKEKVVAERADARWKALIKRDYKGAYGYLSPASREAMSLDKFRARFESADYRAVAVEKVECAEEVCKVMLKLTYDLDMPPAKVRGVVAPLDEDWIIDQGQAWLVFRG